MLKRVFWHISLCAIFISVALSAQKLNAQSDNTFDQTLLEWLASKNLHGKILDDQHIYDEDGFIESLRIVFQEDQKQDERTQPTLSAELSQDANSQTLQMTILNKDLKSLINLKFDWVARLVIRYALNRISNYLGLRLHVTQKNGIYTAVFLPSSITVPSRYRFDELVVTYSVNDLIFNAGIALRGPHDYLVAEYAKNQANSILRALEQGRFPGSYTGGPVIGPYNFQAVKFFDSSSLVRKVLETGEVLSPASEQE